jgi:hypothetical protein
MLKFTFNMSYRWEIMELSRTLTTDPCSMETMLKSIESERCKSIKKRGYLPIYTMIFNHSKRALCHTDTCLPVGAQRKESTCGPQGAPVLEGDVVGNLPIHQGGLHLA